MWPAIALTAIAVEAQPAQAGFRVCNQFAQRVNVSIGYADRARGWVAQGWANIDPGQCKILHQAELDNRYYYLYVKARDGGIWTGDAPFCVKHDKFLLVQAQYGKNTPDDCARAGLESARFFQVDVGQEKNHTYTVTASNNPGGGVPGAEPARPPVATVPGQPSYPQAPQTYPPQQPPYQQPPQTYRPPVATTPPQQPPPYQEAPQPYPQMPQAQPYPPQQPQPYRPPVVTAPQQQPYQQAPQTNRPPVATAPPQQPTYQQAPQPYPQQQPPPQPQPYQQAPQTYRPPVATAPPQQPTYQQAPQQYPYPQQPQPYQQAPQPYPQAPQPQTYQQQPGQPPAAPGGGGTACQRYPNLC
jgi:uncharacterized membrane protein